MTVRDLLASGVKTATQVAVAAILGWLAKAGIEVDQQALDTVIFSITSGAVAVGVNWLGNRYPVVNKILSFGLADTSPTYR